MTGRSGIVVAALATMSAALIASGGALAQAWPTRTVNLVLPYAAGGPTDAVTRVLAQKLGESLGQTVVVENVPGANTMVGAERVARANADGHALLVASVTTLSINPFLYKAIRYKVGDFAPVSMMVKTPFTMTVNKNLPPQTLREFIAYAKERPGKVFHGMNPGRGNTNERLGEMLNLAADIKTVPVPYKGLGAALTAVIAGEIQYMFDSINTTVGAVKAGTVRVLAHTGDKRSPALPDVPTFAEAGFPGMTANFWYGVVTPAATPRPAIERLNAAIIAAFRADDVRARIEGVGLTSDAGTPEAFSAVVQRDAEIWGSVIKRIGLQLDL